MAADSREDPGRPGRQDGPGPEVVFHYSRAARLGRLREPGPKSSGFFAKKRNRTLIVILVDVILVAAVLYFLNRPVDVYLKSTENGSVLELNVTQIKGDRILFGFSITNAGNTPLELRPGKVFLQISRDQDSVADRHASLQASVLQPGESSSVVFLIENRELPSSGTVAVRYPSNRTVFEKNIRF
jgi:hypothetical protein